MTITFEIEPADEAEFNDIYDNDHIPTIMKLPGVREVLRFRDAGANEHGYLVYTAIYFMTEQDLHETPEWKKLSTTPGYTDPEIVSNISNTYLRPTAYSQV